MNTLDHTLELLAARKVDETAVQDAQRKLESLIAARAPRARRTRTVGGWLTAAASAAIAALAFVWLPLNPTPAFAAVQQHLREFRSMRFVIDQRVDGERTVQTRVSVTNTGNVRTEVGDDVSVIVNSAEQRVITLIHSGKLAVVSPLNDAVKKEDALEWLKDIREFQGAAQALPQPRLIDGQKAYGWKLNVNGIDMVLWATDEGVPLSMSMNQGAQLQLDFHFEYDIPLAPELFSTQIPSGYSLAPQED
jgi:hypothetical protein